jgi:hypothetical protein
MMDQFLNQNSKFDELEDILKARLVLNSIRARKHRYYILNRSNRRKNFQFNQSCLRISFTSLILIAFVLGFLIFFPIYTVLINFNYQCPLYASIISFKIVEPLIETNETRISMEINNSKWGQINICIFSITIGILIVSFSVISMFFFVMFNMKERIDNDYFLLWPWVTLSSIFTLLVLVCSCLIANGLDTFCASLVTNTNSKCRDFQFYDWKKFNASFFYDYLLVSLISSWLLFIIMVFIVVAVFFRIVFIYRNYRHEILDLNKKLGSI